MGSNTEQGSKESDVIKITVPLADAARQQLGKDHAAFFRMGEGELVMVTRQFHIERECDLLASFQDHVVKRHENDAILITRGKDVGPAKKKCSRRDCELCENCVGFSAGFEQDVVITGSVVLPASPAVPHGKDEKWQGH